MSRTGKTRAFLTEFIIVILFFSLSVVITLQLFLAAHKQSVLSKEITVAYIKAQNIAEEIRVNGDNLDEFLTSGNGWIENNLTEYESYRRFYDEDWVISNEDTAAYIMTVMIQYHEEDAGRLLEVDIELGNKTEVKKNKKSLCTLELKKYLPDKEDDL